MQHVLNIAFDFDDDKVRQIAEQKVEGNMDEIIKNIILDQIAPTKYNYYNRKNERVWDGFDKRIDYSIQDFINANRDEIIDKAAKMLCESYKRTKAWREKAGDATI